ncbi:MAG: CRTAC1 family protein [Planctomycetota bacterium]|jgi:hypothetical protein
MAHIPLVLALATCLLPLQSGGFAKDAQELRQEERWKDLIALAGEQTGVAENRKLALAYLAVAQAGDQQFVATASTLRKLEGEGVDLDAALAGLGSPMVEVVNTIYSHCWANFDPVFNRKCWWPLYTDFPDSPYAPVAASRLLMAALKTGDAGEARHFEEFFRTKVDAASAAGETARVGDLNKRLVDGYLRAGVSNAQVAGIASAAWDSAWSNAVERHGYEGPMTGGNLDASQRKARLECELDTDHAFNTLAQATFLAGIPLGEGHPLFDMEAEPGVTFTDITEEVGLSGLKVTRVAAADFDEDGDPDLCLGGRLFQNRKGRFTEIGKDYGVTRTAAGAFWGDFDGDGYLDLLIAASPAPTLYRNLGRKGKYRFEDVTNAVGLDRLKLQAGAEGVAWVDYDDDGDLDLYFAVHESGGECRPDAIVENRGKDGFVEVSAELEISGTGIHCGRGVSPCDIDLDGDSEIFVSNYRLKPNLVWSWEDGKLTDLSAAMGVKGVRQPEDGEYFGHTIGSCWGDVDNDGDLDLFSANLAHPRFIRQGFSNLSMLLLQQTDGTFQDEMLTRGIRFQETHSDPAFVDIDNDGDLDLSITCVYEGVASALYQNDGHGNFEPITFRSGAPMFHGWGQAWLDIDGDGFLDVVFGSSNGVRVLRNSGNGNHYIRIALSGKGKDRSAFGAIVRVESMDAEQPATWMRQLHNARGTGSQDEPLVHFGLGDYSGRVKVSVTWPDSDRTESKTPKPDRVYTIKQARKAK